MNSIHGVEAIRNRWLTRPLQAALKALPVVVLTGARQTGKTALALSLPQKRTFVSLDDLGVLGQAHSDPDSLVASRPVTLDEVQRAPELWLPVNQEAPPSLWGSPQRASERRRHSPILLEPPTPPGRPGG